MTNENTTPTIDDLERVTISTDGGVGGRGRTTVVYLTHEEAERLLDEAMARRRA